MYVYYYRPGDPVLSSGGGSIIPVPGSKWVSSYTLGILLCSQWRWSFVPVNFLSFGCVYQFINISLYSNADGRFNLGPSYNDAVLLLPLPDGVDACDISTLTIWCAPFRSIFNRVTLTRSVFVSCSLHEQSLCSNYSLIIGECWHLLCGVMDAVFITACIKGRYM